ncbi:hypothetical protein Scep_006898 [Stephania cephalantha]|uniref:Uncharacterized protein n=1 Tax=Stephania cephalantha TaxID=152367 RepID=A0AAP0K919_9MAGN
MDSAFSKGAIHVSGQRGMHYTDSAFAEGAISVHVHIDMSRGPTWTDYTDSAFTGKTRDIGALITPSQKALSAPHCRIPETDVENIFSASISTLRGGWERSVERDTDEGGRRRRRCCERGGGGAYARRRRRERRCGGVTEQGAAALGDRATQWYVEEFAWQWYVEEEQRFRQRRRDLRRRQRRKEERRQRPYTHRLAVEWKEEDFHVAITKQMDML